MTAIIYDAELVLRDIADGAETATAAETGIALDVLKAGDFKVVLDVTALDATTGNETYVLSVETDANTSFGSAVQVGAVTVTATGRYEVPLSQWQLAKLDSGAAAIRVNATLGGTTPSIAYGAFIVPTV